MKHCLDRENGCNPYGDACSCGCNICLKIPQMETETVKEETKKEFIIRILQEQNKNSLEGKGYDFYFVLRSELDNSKI